jgi:hypothetical protein
MKLTRLKFVTAILAIYAIIAPYKMAAQSIELKTAREVLECNRQSRMALPSARYEAQIIENGYTLPGRYSSYKVVHSDTTEKKLTIVYSDQKFKIESLSIQSLLQDRDHAILNTGEEVIIRSRGNLVEVSKWKPDGSISEQGERRFKQVFKGFPHLAPYGGKQLRYNDFLEHPDKLFPYLELETSIDPEWGLLYKITVFYRFGEELHESKTWYFAANYGCMLVRAEYSNRRLTISPQQIADTDQYIMGERHDIRFFTRPDVDFSLLTGVAYDDLTSRPIKNYEITKLSNFQPMTDGELSAPDLFSPDEVIYNSPLFPGTAPNRMRMIEY